MQLAQATLPVDERNDAEIRKGGVCDQADSLIEKMNDELGPRRWPMMFGGSLVAWSRGISSGATSMQCPLRGCTDANGGLAKETFVLLLPCSPYSVYNASVRRAYLPYSESEMRRPLRKELLLCATNSNLRALQLGSNLEPTDNGSSLGAGLENS